MLTSFDPSQACAIGTLSLNGVDPHKAAADLWAKDRIFVTPIKHEEFSGLRITPNLFTTLAEIDALVRGVERILARS